MTPRTVVVASNNQHKLSELRALLGDSWRVLSAQEVAPGVTWDESGQTFIENARIKIRALRAHTNHAVLADDSGLCVQALGGAPGVGSSSYGGIDGDHTLNNQRLLREMAPIPAGQREAYFTCVIVFVDEGGQEAIYEGKCSGSIAEVMDGAGGFGYDCLFYLPQFGVTMAKLSDAEKNKISHRGQAMQKFLHSQTVETIS